MSSDCRLDQRLVSLVHISVILIVVSVLLFLGYFLAGMTAVMVGVDPFAYPFLTVDEDPVLILFSMFVGIFVCTGSLGQLFRPILSGNNDSDIAINILLSMVALGFGLATLRITFWSLISLIE